MGSRPRVTLAGAPVHLVQRGIDRQACFFTDADRLFYLDELADLAAACGCAVHAWVLMTNHVHLLLTPDDDSGLSRLMQAVGRRYVLWFNKRHARTGTLWEGRFRSSVIESERYLFACSRYIELNPVRAGLVAEPADYRWSSYRHHIGLQPDSLIREHPLIWSLGNTPFERQVAYRRLFDQPGAAQEADALRAGVQGGWAVGTGAFVAAIGQQAGRRPMRSQAGRPPKSLNQSVPD